MDIKGWQSKKGKVINVVNILIPFTKRTEYQPWRYFNEIDL